MTEAIVRSTDSDPAGTDAESRNTPVPVGAAAGIFNSAVAAFAIGAAWELGVLDELRESDVLDSGEVATRLGLHPPGVHSMFTALAAVDVVVRSESKVRKGPAFDDVYRHKGFLHWFAMGSSELFTAMPTVLRNENRVGSFYRRNASAIAFACRDINQVSFDPVFWRAVEGLDFTPQVVADLGCGSGGRLVQIAERFPGMRGVGVDISPAALRDAEEYARATGNGDRLTFVAGDSTALEPSPEFAEVDLLTSFLMGHDMWPRDECVASLRRLREAFPNVRRFLIGDTARTVGIPERQLPVFTLGFELAHDLMGAYLPTLDEWADVFADGGWTCVQVHQVEVPVASVIFELA